MLRIKVVLTIFFALLSFCAPAEDSLGLSGIDVVEKVTQCDLQVADQLGNNGGMACRRFVYRNDGLAIGGFVVRPELTEGASLPTIIFSRGGTGTFGQVDYDMLQTFAFPLAKAGFVVIGSQYRGGDENLSPEETVDEWGGADVGDVEALFDIVDQLPYADGERVGGMGGSRGGLMTFLLARDTNRLKAIAVSGVPTDLSLLLSLRPGFERVFEKHIPRYKERKEEALKERSVVEWVEELDRNMPILIQHGQYDRRVGVEHSLRLASRLQSHGFGYKLIIHEADGHNLSRDFDEFLREIVQWFKEYL